MGLHNDLGREGEMLARTWLVNEGFSILFTNWRYGKNEIDVIAIKNEMPYFIEVKMRSSNAFGFPEESVTKKKISKLLKAVDEFMLLHPEYRDFRLNILSITKSEGMETAYFLIEDVYL
jgi:putative endonuclease